MDDMTLQQLNDILINTWWTHYNGAHYKLLCFTNTEATIENHKKYPVEVVYMTKTGAIWSRPLSEWKRSFTAYKGKLIRG